MPGTVHLKASDPQVQADLNRYYEQCRKDGKNSKEYCARVAWNILCANKSPDYPGCTEFGRGWGPPYSAPKGEAAEDCPCRRGFKFMLAAIQEDKNLEPDGAVRRAEFDDYPETVVADLTAEARLAAERFVVDNTPSYLKFQNVKSQDVVTYGDRRGRAVVVPVAEMENDELVWLAHKMGWDYVGQEAQKALPEPPPTEAESLRRQVGSVMERIEPQAQADIRAAGRVSMDPSVALKWLKLIGQAYQRDDKKAMMGISRAAAKKYGMEEPSLPFEMRKFVIMLSHLAGIKPPPWTSETYIPGVQEAVVTEAKAAGFEDIGNQFWFEKKEGRWTRKELYRILVGDTFHPTMTGTGLVKNAKGLVDVYRDIASHRPRERRGGPEKGKSVETRATHVGVIIYAPEDKLGPYIVRGSVRVDGRDFGVGMNEISHSDEWRLDNQKTAKVALQRLCDWSSDLLNEVWGKYVDSQP